MFEHDLDDYWKSVVDTIHDGIMVIDPRGTIVAVNRALQSITGYRRAEMVGKPCTILNCNICERQLDVAGEHWCRLFATGRLEKRRCSIQTKNQRPIQVLKNASILFGGDGTAVAAVETITDISEIVDRDRQIQAFRKVLRCEDGFHGILGVSVGMQQVFELVANAAKSDAPVIIFGESGTGKELVARALHHVRGVKRRPFVKVNCAALNESLLESELFGHVKGAFTGAYQTREGRFESATGGDIFLDEVGDLPPATQVKLLRVLEEKVIERVGDNRPIPVDVRVITATNKDLDALVQAGVFREDLYYRINVIPINVPPLRERPEDVPLLAEFFLRKLKLKAETQARGLSNEAMALLVEYPWPGNVRELKSAFEYAFVTCNEPFIRPCHLPRKISERDTGFAANGRQNFSKQAIQKMDLLRVLEETGGNQSKAARMLGVSRVTVWNRMRRFGVDIGRNVRG